MQQDLPADVVILGLNEDGHESGNDDFCDGRDVPWMQDDGAVWDDWGVIYRDIVILDRDGNFHTVFNVTSNDLGDEENYWGLVTTLSDLAAE